MPSPRDASIQACPVVRSHEVDGLRIGCSMSRPSHCHYPQQSFPVTPPTDPHPHLSPDQSLQHHIGSPLQHAPTLRQGGGAAVRPHQPLTVGWVVTWRWTGARGEALATGLACNQPLAYPPPPPAHTLCTHPLHTTPHLVHTPPAYHSTPCAHTPCIPLHPITGLSVGGT